MSKIALRLIVVILIVAVSVVITTAILNTPNYNTQIYQTWLTASQDNRYDLDQKFNQKIVSTYSEYNDKTIIEKEQKIANAYLIEKALNDQLNRLVQKTKYSVDVEEIQVKTITTLMNEYYQQIINDDGVGYWTDYYYNRVQRAEFDPSNTDSMAIYNSVVNKIYTGIIKQIKLGAEMISVLNEQVSKTVLRETNSCDIQSILLDMRATYAICFARAENYATFETNHLTEFKNLSNKVDEMINNINYNDETTIALVGTYYITTITDKIRLFVESNRSAYISSISDEATKESLSKIKSFVEAL